MMRKHLIRGNFAQSEVEPSEERVLRLVVERLRQRLPADWDAELELPSRPQARSRAAQPDAVLNVRAPDGSSGRLIIEAKRRLDPRLVPIAVDQLARYRSEASDGGMVVAAYLSRRARELLTEARLGYADATGNLRLMLDRPALYIETQGADSDPWAKPGNRSLRSLKGPTAGRIVRALCDFRPPYGVEQLVKLSGTSLGSVARVFALLDGEALIEREPRGPVTGVKWLKLIRRWAEDYSFARTNTTYQFLEPRGVAYLLNQIKGATWPYAITGSLAGARLAPIATPALATVYVEDFDLAAAMLRLRPAARGSNVLLVEPFDRVVFERTWVGDDLRYAALSQVAIDLLTGPGRSPAEGEALLRWMQEHEDGWRT